MVLAIDWQKSAGYECHLCGFGRGLAHRYAVATELAPEHW